ncbi:MAG: SpoIVB peptidase [Clostridiales bacterium]|nr:SpoIVB peptidase [Clostridiales bacterium]
MINKRKYRAGRFAGACATVSIIAVCSLFLYLLTGIASFPDKIHIMEGRETVLTAAFPLKAELKGAYRAVSAAGDERAPIGGGSAETEEFSEDFSEDKSTLELTFLGIKLKEADVEVLPDIEVAPCGLAVGVRIMTDGVMVLGVGAVPSADGVSLRPSDDKLLSGDLIFAANGRSITGKDDLIAIVEAAPEGAPVSLSIKRGAATIVEEVTPARTADGEAKLGVWVRDSTQGIGTLTYYNKTTGAFGALGHGILDVDTKRLIKVKTGTISRSDIVSVKKGEQGAPGELVGETRLTDTIGEIRLNSELGLYGYVTDTALLPDNFMPIALQADIHEGPARMVSSVRGMEPREYDVFIESVNRYSDDLSKGMVVRITDKDLLTTTNGIVQGMSGSPLIQDGKLIGAVTHVFVQNPTKGYGVFIENMISQERRLDARD